MAVEMQIYQREEVGLTISDRPQRGKGPVGRLRREDHMLPGILYGHKQDPLAFKIAARSLERALSQGGQNAIFLLQFDGNGAEPDRAVVREIQYHKVTGDIMHVDMQRIDPDERVRIDVPLVTTGIPVGVRIGGGGLQHTLTQVQMECLASELPSRIEIDISDLEIDQSIHVGDLLDQEKRITTEAGVAIVSVLPPRLTVDEEIELAAEDEEVELEEGEVPEGEEAPAEAAEPEGEAQEESGEES